MLGFTGYILLLLLNNKSTNSDGFNTTKDLLEEYDSINIVENRGMMTFYNIKRGVIKISSKYYYGNTISSLSIPLMEAGISIVDSKKNKFISFMKNIIPNLKWLYFLPVLAIVLNITFYNSSDAKIGILLLCTFSCVTYFLIGIKSEAIELVDSKLKKNKSINKDDKSKIIKFLNRIILFDKLIFVGELLMIIRFVAVILEFE